MGVKIYNEMDLKEVEQIKEQRRVDAEDYNRLKEQLKQQKRDSAEAIAEITNLIAMIMEGGAE